MRACKAGQRVAESKIQGGIDTCTSQIQTWYIERLIRLIAGLFVLAGSLLGFIVHPNWFLFTGFVGAMLMIFALTGLCPVSIILYAMGARERCTC